MDRGSSCPGEEEQADGRTERGDESWDESAFLDGPAALGDARVHVVVEVTEVETNADDTGDENAEEDEADLTKVHAVVDGVDTGEHLEDWGELVNCYASDRMGETYRSSKFRR